MRRWWLGSLLLILQALPAHASQLEQLDDRPGDVIGPCIDDGSAYGLVCFLGVTCLLGGLLARHFRRTTTLSRAAPVPVSLLVAERLARVVQRRHGVIAAVGIVGVPALIAMGVGPLAIFATIVGSIGLRGFFIARAVLHLIEASGDRASAEARAHIVTVRTPDREEHLEVAPGALAAALRHAVPTSIARR